MLPGSSTTLLDDLFTTLRDHGLYRDEYKDFCEEMQRLRALRGKVKER